MPAHLIPVVVPVAALASVAPSVAAIAMGLPPGNVIAVVVFLVGAILSGIQRDWKFTLLFSGLAALAWPWG